MLEKRDDAEREYRDAIARLTALASGGSPAATDQQALATAYNWLGETVRVQAGRQDDAAAAYDRALELQQALVTTHPDNVVYQVERARTLSNRGILRALIDSGMAERDFRDSIALLEPLTDQSDRALQDLGRAANNLAAVLDAGGGADARDFYERAVIGHEQLVARDPDHRVYQLELATFADNFAVFLQQQGDPDAANLRSRQAIDLITALARPAPSLAIERADAHTLRGMILQARDAAESDDAYERALDLFGEIQSAPAVLRMPLFHERFGDLLINLALRARAPGQDRSSQLLSRGLEQYAAIARQILASGASSEMRVVVDTIASVMPELADRDRIRLTAIQEELRRALTTRGSSSGDGLRVVRRVLESQVFCSPCVFFGRPPPGRRWPIVDRAGAGYRRRGARAIESRARRQRVVVAHATAHDTAATAATAGARAAAPVDGRLHQRRRYSVTSARTGSTSARGSTHRIVPSSSTPSAAAIGSCRPIIRRSIPTRPAPDPGITTGLDFQQLYVQAE